MEQRKSRLEKREFQHYVSWLVALADVHFLLLLKCSANGLYFAVAKHFISAMQNIDKNAKSFSITLSFLNIFN